MGEVLSGWVQALTGGAETVIRAFGIVSPDGCDASAVIEGATRSSFPFLTGGMGGQT